MLESSEGCDCGEPCPWGKKFFVWVDVPFEIVRSHYQKILSKWQDVLREEGSPPKPHSNEESRQTGKSRETSNS
jgi:hypothetical protein